MNNDRGKYIKSFSNDTNDTHVLIKIYWEFYHSIVNKANEDVILESTVILTYGRCGEP